MRSLRTKIVLALLFSSFLAAVCVGLIARYMVYRQFSQDIVERAFANFQVDARAYYERYGSWEKARANQSFPSFVAEHRRIARRNILRPPIGTPIPPPNAPLPPNALLSPSNLPFPPPSPPYAPPPNGDVLDSNAPFRFTVVDSDGVIILPESRVGQNGPKRWFSTALALESNGSVIGYALPDGEIRLSQQEQSYLIALGIAFRYALLITAPLVILLGFFFAEQFTRPLRHLTHATRAMTQGRLKQQVKVRTKDEIGHLGKSFNQMSNDLSTTYRELEQAKDSAEESSRAKSIFLSNMSHELRTPLNAIIGFSQLMGRDRELNKSQVENLSIIQDSGEHLLQLINNVLSMAKIEAGKYNINKKSFEVKRFIDNLVAMFELSATSKGLRFEIDSTSAIPQYVVSDENMLRQVLTNLISNAIKFTEEGGVNLLIDYKNGKHLYFEVVDTGQGIAPDELPKIFEAFEQTESGRQSKVGTGLGLNLSKHFVTHLGGELRVKSVLGEGTAFAFEVPAKASQKTSPKSQQRRVTGLTPSSPKATILVVDDKLENRKLLCSLLEAVGLVIYEATNGKEALESWRNLKSDFIWMDLRMPVMDGFEATRHIKNEANKNGIEVKIAALTASVFKEDEDMVLSQNFDGFVRKPYRENQIFSILSQQLGLQYLYEEDEATNVNDTIKPEDLQALPQNLRGNVARCL